MGHSNLSLRRLASLLAAAALLTACASAASPTPTTAPSHTPIVAASLTASAVPSHTPRPPTATPTPTLTATPTGTSTDTPTPTATPTSTPLVNLLTNSGFEAGDWSGWEVEGEISLSSAAAFSGAYGARMEAGGRIIQVFKTRVGAAYAASARVRIDEETVAPEWGGLLVSVTSWDWQPLGSGPFLTLENSPAGQWTRISFAFVATTDQSRMIFQNFSGGGQFRASADAFVITGR
jgi:hypothetical protein